MSLLLLTSLALAVWVISPRDVFAVVDLFSIGSMGDISRDVFAGDLFSIGSMGDISRDVFAGDLFSIGSMGDIICFSERYILSKTDCWYKK